ncbi:MAG: CoA transferase subunit A [Dehalococcoidia bacterium]
MAPARAKKVGTLEDAAKLIEDGMGIAIGGMLAQNVPCAMVRQIVKKGAKNLSTYAAPPVGYPIDLLVGAGLVKRTHHAYCGFEYLGFAPNFRKAVEEGSVEAIVCDEAIVAGGFMAAAEGLPYHSLRSPKGTDYIKVNPLLTQYTPPWGEEKLVAVKAFDIDVALIHAQEADEYGNIRFLGSYWLDPTMARATDTVIVTVDRLVSHERVLSEPALTSIPGVFVTMVVPLPYGAHPCASHMIHMQDEEHLIEYVRLGRMNLKNEDPEAFSNYLKKHVYESETHLDYLERVGGLKRLSRLNVPV